MVRKINGYSFFQKNADGSIKSLVADTELEGTTVEFSVIKIFSSEKQIVDRKIE